MEAFRHLDSVAAPLPQPNVDTDQILPARFLRKMRSTGYGNYLFYDVRFLGEGVPNPAFMLNQPIYKDARLIVSDRNFGCGSSREGAVYALYDYGIRSVIAPSFGDIFYNNSCKNGLLPVALPQEVVTRLLERLAAEPGAAISVDLESQTVTLPGGTEQRFEIDAFKKDCLLNGLDDVSLTLQQGPVIDRFEAERFARLPWIAG